MIAITIRVAQMPKTVTKVPTELPKEITNLSQNVFGK